MEWVLAAKTAFFLAKCARFVKANKAVWQVRNAASVRSFKALHVNLIHRIRRLPIELTGWHDLDSLPLWPVKFAVNAA